MAFSSGIRRSPVHSIATTLPSGTDRTADTRPSASPTRCTRIPSVGPPSVKRRSPSRRTTSSSGRGSNASPLPTWKCRNPRRRARSTIAARSSEAIPGGRIIVSRSLTIDSSSGAVKKLRDAARQRGHGPTLEQVPTDADARASGDDAVLDHAKERGFVIEPDSPADEHRDRRSAAESSVLLDGAGIAGLDDVRTEVRGGARRVPELVRGTPVLLLDVGHAQQRQSETTALVDRGPQVGQHVAFLADAEIHLDREQVGAQSDGLLRGPHESLVVRGASEARRRRNVDPQHRRRAEERSELPHRALVDDQEVGAAVLQFRRERGELLETIDRPHGEGVVERNGEELPLGGREQSPQSDRFSVHRFFTFVQFRRENTERGLPHVERATSRGALPAPPVHQSQVAAVRRPGASIARDADRSAIYSSKPGPHYLAFPVACDPPLVASTPSTRRAWIENPRSIWSHICLRISGEFAKPATI